MARQYDGVGTAAEEDSIVPMYNNKSELDATQAIQTTRRIPRRPVSLAQQHPQGRGQHLTTHPNMASVDQAELPGQLHQQRFELQ